MLTSSDLDRSADDLYEALRRGAAYEPTQLSRGMVAYGAVLALQSPEFVQGVRTYAADAAQRNTVITRIGTDPAYAAQLPGAEAAAGLIAAALGAHAADLLALGAAIEEDAYTIQERDDPRRRWATSPVLDRQGRLDSAKALSVAPMLPSADESARLFQEFLQLLQVVRRELIPFHHMGDHAQRRSAE